MGPTYLRGLIIRLQQLHFILNAMKPAIVLQESCFCLLQTFVNVLLLSA